MTRDVSTAGSLWRRWDLHIHAPGTALNDQFEGWPTFIRVLNEAMPPAVVLGITDYCTLETYKSVLGAFKRGALPDHVKRTEEALAGLRVRLGNDYVPCSKEGLVRFGRTKVGTNTNEATALREGVKHFKVGFEVLREWREKEKWLHENSLVAVASGADGLAGLRHDSGFTSFHDEIARWSHIIFSGNSSDREYWLGHGVDDVHTLRARFGSPKPTLHGCDAHVESQVLAPEQERFCWIKADPTFEGLRQVLFEPEERISIGPEAPARHNLDQVIEKVSIRKSHGWFEDDEILLNPGMVSVIGPKGSGKTALVDCIAASAGATVDPEQSFLARAAEHIGDLEVNLRWASGRESGWKRDLHQKFSSTSEVRYLSQRFVERLCSGSHLSDELREEIEAVVFSYLEESERLEASSFDELRSIRTSSLVQRRTAIRGEIATINQDVSRIDQRRLQVPQKTRRVDQLAKEIECTKKQFPRIEDEETKRVLSELAAEKSQRADLLRQVGVLEKRRQAISDLASELQDFQRQMDSFWFRVKPRLVDLSIQQPEHFKPSFAGNTEPGLKKAESEVASAIFVLKTGGNDVGRQEKANLEILDKNIELLEKRLKLGEQKTKKLQELQKQVELRESEKAKIEAELTEMNTTVAEERERLVSRRMDLYVEYFRLLADEEAVLQSLYAPLQAALKSRPEHEGLLALYVDRGIDLETWSEKGEELLDQRRSGVFQERGSVARAARRHLHNAWKCGREDALRSGIDEMIALLKEAGALKQQLREQYNLVDVADWLFSLDHIDLRYGIRYAGTDISRLSPGTKGIVLLILYLAIDREDTRPLIIDQPDENLDNQSVFEILRSFFRAAKAKRQILVVTHNPNLVVNTDAEQVVVASCGTQENGLPAIKYLCGALESVNIGPIPSTMKEKVCTILEGGKEAFRQREQKYTSVLDKGELC